MSIFMGPQDMRQRPKTAKEEVAELRSKLSSVRLALFVLIAMDTTRWAVILYHQFSS